MNGLPKATLTLPFNVLCAGAVRTTARSVSTRASRSVSQGASAGRSGTMRHTKNAVTIVIAPSTTNIHCQPNSPPAPWSSISAPPSGPPRARPAQTAR